MGEGFFFEAGALLPSIGVGLLFWFAVRSILRADRREREADRRAEKDVRARLAAERAAAAHDPGTSRNSQEHVSPERDSPSSGT